MQINVFVYFERKSQQEQSVSYCKLKNVSEMFNIKTLLLFNCLCLEVNIKFYHTTNQIRFSQKNIMNYIQNYIKFRTNNNCFKVENFIVIYSVFCSIFKYLI